ncbi:MAG: OmpA family protein [Hyphomicrobiales bacterium]|nr:OmpA family protein [Hyphomicrobiales bacterium]
MEQMSARLKIKLAGAVLSLGLVLPLSTGFAAEQRSTEDIINALKPATATRVTRSLTTTPAADTARSPDEARFIDSLRNRTSRSLSTEEREMIVSIAKSKPSIDLEINFDYNSATLGGKAMPQVAALGKALTSDELKGSTFVVAGHTDAKGGDAYNQSLSERRAESVRRFLRDKYGIEATNLVAVGHGKSQLKDSSNPLAAENRRVQIINLVK